MCFHGLFILRIPRIVSSVNGIKKYISLQSPKISKSPKLGIHGAVVWRHNLKYFRLELSWKGHWFSENQLLWMFISKKSFEVRTLRLRLREADFPVAEDSTIKLWKQPLSSRPWTSVISSYFMTYSGSANSEGESDFVLSCSVCFTFHS